MNQAKTALLLLVLTSILIGIGLLLDAWTGAFVMLGLAAIFNGYAFWYSDAIALRIYDARPADTRAHARLICIVHALARHAAMPVPAIYVADTGDANAFATGRSPGHAALIVTRDLLQALDHEELAGVIAHELSHIRSRDSWTLTVTATLAGAVAILGATILAVGKLVRGGGGGGGGAVAAVLFGLLAILTAVAAQLAIGRQREYAADQAAAELCGSADGLIQALEKLARRNAIAPVTATRLATASLMFVSPLGEDWRSRLFETHPSIEQRITRLKRLQRHARGKRQPFRKAD